MRFDERTANFGRQGAQRLVTLAEIDDPVAGYVYVLDPVHHTAYRIPYCTPTPRPPAAAPVTSAHGPGGTAQTEDLGTKTMFGITVTGQRTTITFPPGSYMGNDIPVQRITEDWRSPQYGVFLSKDTQPDRENTNTITTFSAAEPDPSLFQVPPGYQVVDETAPFTVTIHYDN